MTQQSFPAVLESLAELRRFVKNAAEAAGVVEDKVYKLQLAVDEIATNIISYGYAESGAGAGAVVTIESKIHEDMLVVTLTDQSPAFDPRQAVLPETKNLEKPPEERGIGGLGIYLAINGVDHFDYQYKNGCNLNILGVRVGK